MGKKVGPELFHPEKLSDDEKVALLEEYFRYQNNPEKSMNRKKWLRKHPEDILLDEENMNIRYSGYDKDGIRALMSAVCLRACADYQKACKGKSYDKVPRPPYAIQVECRMLFDSDMMNFFTNGMSVKEIENAIKELPDDKDIATVWRTREKL